MILANTKEVVSLNKKKQPLRQCLVTREKLPKQELIRIVLNKEGHVFIDKEGKANGRGAYLKPELAVIKKAILAKSLDKQLKTKIPLQIYQELEAMFIK